jgi:hypothetical protein
MAIQKLDKCVALQEFERRIRRASAQGDVADETLLNENADDQADERMRDDARVFVLDVIIWLPVVPEAEKIDEIEYELARIVVYRLKYGINVHGSPQPRHAGSTSRRIGSALVELVNYVTVGQSIT